MILQAVGQELENFSSSLHALHVSLVGNRERTDYLIALEEGGLGNESALARRQIAGAVTEEVSAAIVAHKVIIASTPLVNNLFLIAAQHPLQDDDRIRWWKWHGRPTQFNTNQEALQDLIEKIAETENVCTAQENMLIKPNVSEQDRFLAKNALKRCKKFTARSVMPVLEQGYETYLSERGHFVVLVPKSLKTDQSSALTEAGLLATKLTPIAVNERQQLFSQYEVNELLVDQLKTFFNPSNKARKNIMLVGHGTPTPTFAGLRKPEYQKLLQVFNTIGCVSLLVISCFTGGDAVTRMHETEHVNQGATFDLHDINFIILMGATAETPMGASIEISTYYDAINTFTKTRRQTDLKKAVQAMHGDSPERTTPSIYYPTKSRDLPPLFRAVNVDTGIVRLTFAEQKTLLLDAKIAQKPTPTVTLATDQTLLYYPANIQVSLVIQGAAKVISMAQGKFVHTFEKISAPELPLYQCISRIIGTIKSSARVYVIDELVCQGQIVHGLVIAVTQQNLKAYWHSGNTYKELTHPHGMVVGQQFSENEITEQSIPINNNIYMASSIFDIEQATPTLDVIRQSSGGNETIDMVIDAAVGVICKTAGIDYQKVILLTNATQERLLRKQGVTQLVVNNGSILLCGTGTNSRIPLVIKGSVKLIPLHVLPENFFHWAPPKIIASTHTLAQTLADLFGTVRAHNSFYNNIPKISCQDQDVQDVTVRVKPETVELIVRSRRIERQHHIPVGEIIPEAFFSELLRQLNI
jgi:hypothetical protein